MRGKSRAAAGMVFLAVAFSSLSAAAGRTMRPSSKRWARAPCLAYQNYQGPSPPRQRRNRFTITAPYPPAADQPAAIRSIVERFERGERYSILRGCTGTGKTMVMAHTIARLGRPTLVLCHNKTLAAQLARELRSFLRKNHVHLFVSYYNHYVPESYSEASGRYTSKKSSINDELDALRHMATRALVQHEDVVVVASVSCIYGLGMPRSYLDASLTWHADGSTRFGSMDDVVDALEANLYENAVDENAQSYTGDLGRGQYELTKEGSEAASVSLWPPYELFPLRIDLEKISEAGDTGWKVSGIALGNNVGLTPVPDVTIFPAKHHVSDSEDTFQEALRRIQDECTDQAEKLRQDGKSVEADRLQQRVANDLLLLKESGSCPGVENYSRHFNLREAGETPDTLLDYFGLRNGGDDGWMLMVDESHVALPQLKAMHGGDRARKEKLVKHGYRLPSAMDNRPLTVDEFWERAPQTLFVSATPGRREVQLAEGACVDMAIRPTFVPDPVIAVRPPQNQLEDLAKEIRERAAKNERTLALALTKKDAEDLSAYLTKHGIRADYLHSGLKTHDRSKALNALQVGDIDCLVGVNILREGLDLPEVSLVAVLGADVEGFLRSETALLQMIGRAARNVNGKAILYANQITKSMKACIDATVQRRSKQLQYNELHGKEMRSTVGSSCLSIFDILKDRIDAEQSQSLGIIAADSGQDDSRGSSTSQVKTAISVKKSSHGRLLTDHVPSKPGVYAWKCEKGTTLYIGKAKRLRSRVKSYLAPGAKHSQRIKAMLKKAHRVEFVLTPSERDALVLESSLIKHHQPPYNVLLKDDETYPFICASISDPLPSFSLVPRPLTTPQARNYKYFGPYPNIKEINEILAGIESKYDLRSKHFQVRFGDLSPTEYEEDFARALDEVFLSPSASQQLPTLRSEYEEASKLFQHKHNLERDIVSIARFDDGAKALVHIVQLRDGFVAGQYSYSCTLQAGIGCEQDLGSLIQYALEQKHYPQAGLSQTSSGISFFPKELLVQYELPDAKNLRALFRQQHYSDEDASLQPRAASREGAKATAKLTIRTPAVRGVRKETDKRALEFALDNAEEAVRQRVLAATEGATQTSLDGTAAKELAELLSLETIPNRIEAFDISHTKGDVAVGSRIVFEEGKPLKKDYRRFNVRSVDGIDDYASLEEVLNRRFSRAWINGEGGLVSEDDPWCLPDLVVIDGGKGQLSAAMKGMARAGIFASNGNDSGDEESRRSRSARVPIVSLAKNLEEVFAPESSSPINDLPDSAALLLLRSLRDESHRFALANHRRRRSRLSGLK